MGNKQKRMCPACKHDNIRKGRTADGRRAYKCGSCENIWTEGMQGRTPHYHHQRGGFQFAHSKGTGHIK